MFSVWLTYSYTMGCQAHSHLHCECKAHSHLSYHCEAHSHLHYKLSYIVFVCYIFEMNVTRKDTIGLSVSQITFSVDNTGMGQA